MRARRAELAVHDWVLPPVRGGIDAGEGAARRGVCEAHLPATEAAMLAAGRMFHAPSPPSSAGPPDQQGQQPLHPCTCLSVQRLGHEGSLAYSPWPEADPALLQEVSVKLAVQVNGKVRAVLELDRESSQDEARAAAEAVPAVARQLQGKTVSKAIWVPGKVLNLIVK